MSPLWKPVPGRGSPETRTGNLANHDLPKDSSTAPAAEVPTVVAEASRIVQLQKNGKGLMGFLPLVPDSGLNRIKRTPREFGESSRNPPRVFEERLLAPVTTFSPSVVDLEDEETEEEEMPLDRGERRNMHDGPTTSSEEDVLLFQELKGMEHGDLAIVLHLLLFPRGVHSLCTLPLQLLSLFPRLDQLR
ncbi:hypothetical protein K7X08_002708 [Anisodus acutangulus]|uniref:Uncharacterized protein n=1 Tax=Anisodus acutangulus TaxID=402998 RepID=A0A9Q1RF21_9SOLA|nr:hypothetical protein K7X08_002708 [Anisodus acutangulus]